MAENDLFTRDIPTAGNPADGVLESAAVDDTQAITTAASGASDLATAAVGDTQTTQTTVSDATEAAVESANTADADAAPTRDWPGAQALSTPSGELTPTVATDAALAVFGSSAKTDGGGLPEATATTTGSAQSTVLNDAADTPAPAADGALGNTAAGAVLAAAPEGRGASAIFESAGWPVAVGVTDKNGTHPPAAAIMPALGEILSAVRIGNDAQGQQQRPWQTPQPAEAPLMPEAPQAPAAGSVSGLSGGFAGLAAWIADELAHLATWHAMLDFAAHSPSGIVLPNLAPPG